MPSRPKKIPTAPRENATGKPISSVTISPQNISGAMFAMIQAFIAGRSRCRRRCRLGCSRLVSLLEDRRFDAARARHFLRELLFGRLAVVLLEGIGNAPGQESDALDE